MSVYQASRVVGIKNATAKVIVRRYRRDGAIFRRRKEKYQENEESGS